MSEHELWNELGNLYYLAGSYDQAIHAYNKAIQLKNDFGKPYSNLALVFTKQAKYEQAIKLYKRSLELLTDVTEQAITWDRLGNAYRHKKEYPEAVFAYQYADDLRSVTTNQQETPDQFLYVSSESEALPYDGVEEQFSYQNHSVDFLHEVEPEFEEEVPDLIPVDMKILADEIANKPVTMLPFKNDGKLFFVVQENESDALPESVVFDEVPDLEQPIALDDLEEMGSFEEIPTDESVQPTDENSMTDISQAVEEIEMDLDKETRPRSETDVSEMPVSEIPAPDSVPVSDEVSISQTDSEEVMLETGSVLAESISPVEEHIETSGETKPAELEADSASGEDVQETDSILVEPIAQANEGVEFLPDIEVSTEPDAGTYLETGLSGSDSSLADPIAQVDANPVKQEFDPDPVTRALDLSSAVDEEDVQEEKREIGPEEEKLTKQIEINPRSSSTWEALGTLYKTAGRYMEAVQAFKHAISISPDQVSYYHNLGLVYAAQGNNEEAFNTFQKVLELDPNHSLTHASLGGYYKKIGLDELAQKHIGKAMKNIYESENEYNRACLDAICGNYDQAIELLHVALENQQTYVDWVLNDPDLDPLRDDERFQQLISEFSK